MLPDFLSCLWPVSDGEVTQSSTQSPLLPINPVIGYSDLPVLWWGVRPWKESRACYTNQIRSRSQVFLTQSEASQLIPLPGSSVSTYVPWLAWQGGKPDRPNACVSWVPASCFQMAPKEALCATPPWTVGSMEVHVLLEHPSSSRSHPCLAMFTQKDLPTGSFGSLSC